MITSYEQLNIGAYLRVSALVAGDKDGKDPDTDLRIIAALSGHSEEDLLHMPLSAFMELKAGANFLFFEPKPRTMQKAYDIPGWHLIPCRDWRRMSTAQYKDFKEYTTANEPDLLTQLCSVFLVPEGKEYGEGYDIIDLQDAIREHLGILDAFAIADFFENRLARLTADSLTCSAKMTMRLKTIPKKERRKAAAAQMLAALSAVSGAGHGKWMRLRSLPAAVGRRSNQ